VDNEIGGANSSARLVKFAGEPVFPLKTHRRRGCGSRTNIFLTGKFSHRAGFSEGKCAGENFSARAEKFSEPESCSWWASVSTPTLIAGVETGDHLSVRSVSERTRLQLHDSG